MLGATRDRPLRQLLAQLGSRPAHAPETLVHFAVDLLHEDTQREAAELLASRPDATPAQLSAEVADRAVRRATVQGAIAGTPLYLVLVPAYVAVLLEQIRMVLTIAALHGRATDRVEAAADLLAVSLIHPDPVQARREVEVALVGDPSHARSRRRDWLDVGRALLILTNMITPKELDSAGGRLKTAALTVAGLVAFVLTFIFTFFSIVALAWASESTTDKLSIRTRRHYGDPDVVGSVSLPRRWAWQIALVISAVYPVLLLILGVKSHHHGVTVTHVIFFFVALALVVAAFRRLLPTGRGRRS